MQMVVLKVAGLLVAIASPLFLDRIERTFRWHFDYVPCPAGEKLDMTGPFPAYGGISFVTEAPALEAISDGPGHAMRSPVRICEDNRQLGTGHIVHADIVSLGKGRFSHWGRYIIFTASDNSNPNTNGRKYAAVKMEYVTSLVWHRNEPPTLAELIESGFKGIGK
jgi:hypothetical protein